MQEQEEWIAPEQAALEMSRLAGYWISTDDIRQMRRRGVIKQSKRITRQVSLYNLHEIRSVKPPQKRNPQYLKSEEVA